MYYLLTLDEKRTETAFFPDNDRCILSSRLFQLYEDGVVSSVSYAYFRLVQVQYHQPVRSHPLMANEKSV